jgi:hypothetical protein
LPYALARYRVLQLKTQSIVSLKSEESKEETFDQLVYAVELMGVFPVRSRRTRVQILNRVQRLKRRKRKILPQRNPRPPLRRNNQRRIHKNQSLFPAISLLPETGDSSLCPCRILMFLTWFPRRNSLPGRSRTYPPSTAGPKLNFPHSARATSYSFARWRTRGERFWRHSRAPSQ